MNLNHNKKKMFLSKFSIKSIFAWFDSHIVDKKNETKESHYKINLVRVFPFIFLHIACLGVFFVGWSLFAVLFCIGFYLIRMFAITGFYHRYFSHKTFKTNRFWQFLFALLGATCVQRGALWWAAHHRHHHRYSDTEEDFHSPRRRGFFWSHMGWITTNGAYRTKYELVQDFAKYKELVFLNRYDGLIPFVCMIVIFSLGYGLNFFFPFLNTNGPQLLVWGFFISSVILFHGTVTINSLSHVWGKRRFSTNDDSRNNFILSLITLGEGWHNNHHYYPGTVRQGFYWWELDVTFYILKFLQFLGIIHSLRGVPPKVYKDAKLRTKLLKEKKLNRKKVLEEV